MLIAEVRHLFSPTKPNNIFFSAVLIDTDTFEKRYKVQISDRNIPYSKWENVKYRNQNYKILDVSPTTLTLDKVGEVDIKEVFSFKTLDEGFYLFSHIEKYTQISTGRKVEKLIDGDSIALRYKEVIEPCHPLDLEFSHYYINLHSRVNPMLGALIESGTILRDEIDSHLSEELMFCLQEGSNVLVEDNIHVVDRVEYDKLFLKNKKYPVSYKNVKQILSF